MFFHLGCRVYKSQLSCNRFTEEHGRLLGLLEDPFSIAVFNALQHQEVIRLKDLLSEDNRYLYHELFRNAGDEIIGTSQGLKNIMDVVSHISGFNNLVMLFGETGVGKEVIANAIHYNSPRANGPFIKVNCGAIPDNLIDSHLFGHEKGSFTGAISDKRGHFERAHNGTLFLDEIGDLPIAVQGRLLRVLETKEIERVGGTQSIKVDVRIIAATHRNLEEMVRKGQFREDLWFRLHVFPITIPPLRQRREDIPALVEYFIKRKSRELNLKHLPSISAKTVKRMQAYDWPGNVRELANVVERELIRNVIGSQNTLIQFDEFLQHAETVSTKAVTKESSVSLSLDEITRQHFHRILQLTGGKIHGKNGAAEILRLNPSTLRHRLRKLGIPFSRSTLE